MLGGLTNPVCHLKGGEMSLPMLGTARLRNGFDRKREHKYVEYRRANEFQERPELTIGIQKTVIRQNIECLDDLYRSGLFHYMCKVKMGYHGVSVASKSTGVRHFSSHRIQISKMDTRRGHGLMKVIR